MDFDDWPVLCAPPQNTGICAFGLGLSIIILDFFLRVMVRSQVLPREKNYTYKLSNPIQKVEISNPPDLLGRKF